MNNKKDKLNLFWLAKKGLMRLKFWFILKMFIIILWVLTIFNLIIIYKVDSYLFKDSIINHLFISLFFLINIILIILFSLITSFSLKIRQTEFGLYRCNGARRSEIISLIIKESLLLTLIALIFLIIIEIFLIFYFHADVSNLLKIKYNAEFYLILTKSFSLSILFIFLISFFTYIPIAVYYAFKDPYDIIRY